MMSKDESYRVNTSHRLTEHNAVQLPMNRKLKKHFAQNACDSAMEKLVDLFDSSLTGHFDVHEALNAIKKSEKFDSMKKN